VNGWPASTLAEVAEIGAGNSAPQDDRLFKDGVHPFIRTSDVGQIRFGSISTAADLLNEEGIEGLRLFPKGTILMPKSGASTFLNHRVEMSEDGYVSSHLATVHARPNVCDGRFLLYYLSTVRAQDLIQDHKYPSLTLGTIGDIRVPLPPLDEQKRIVAVLDQAFAALDRARANAEENLVDTDELLKCELSDIFADKSAPLIEMRALFEVGSSKRVLKSQWQGHGVPFYRGREVTKLSLHGFVENDLFISEKHFTELKTRYGVPVAGDIVITAIGTIGNAHIVRQSDRFYFKDASVLWMKKIADVSSEYVLAWLKSPEFFEQLDTGNGATVDTLTIQKLQGIRIRMPSIEQQRRIVTKLNALRAEVSQLQGGCVRKVEDLKELRQSLLQAAFSGQLT